VCLQRLPDHCRRDGRHPAILSHGRGMPRTYAILTTPHLRNLLASHDIVAQRDYLPKLKDVPLEVDEDEETVKLVQLVKSQEPLGNQKSAEPIVGATIKAEEGTGRILIARVMHGGRPTGPDSSPAETRSSRSTASTSRAKRQTTFSKFCNLPRQPSRSSLSPTNANSRSASRGFDSGPYSTTTPLKTNTSPAKRRVSPLRKEISFT